MVTFSLGVVNGNEMGWRRPLQKLFIHSCSFCPACFMHNSGAVGLGVIILTTYTPLQQTLSCYDRLCHVCSSHADDNILFLQDSLVVQLNS